MVVKSTQPDFDGIYQDVLVNGEVVHKGRECSERLEMIKPHFKKGDSVLDVGSHSGYFAIELARMGGKVDSWECDKKCIEVQKWAIKENNVDVNLYPRKFSPGLVNKKYDLVLLLAVLQYYYVEDFLENIIESGDKFIIEFPTPEETDALYIDMIKLLHPMDEYLSNYFSKVETIGEPIAPYMNVKRKMYLCEK